MGLVAGGQLLEARTQKKILFNSGKDFDNYKSSLEKRNIDFYVSKVRKIKVDGRLPMYEVVISSQYNSTKLL